MNRSNLIIGPGYATRNGFNFRYAEGGARVKPMKKFREVTTEEFDRIDSMQYDRQVDISMKIWSGYENLGALFPSSMLTPAIGAGIMPAGSDIPWTFNGQDGSRIVVANTAIIAFTNLTLSTEKDLWSADVKGIGLLKSNALPTDANAYFTESTGNSYAAPSFTKSNFLAPAPVVSWGARAGFTSMAMRKGLAIDGKFDINWEPGFVDGYGTIQGFIKGFEATAKGSPIGPTEPQYVAQFGMSTAMGALESGANCDDLVITASGLAITLPQSFIADFGEGIAYARATHRLPETTWRTTVPFSAGAPIARAAIA